jgi:hypothetical protein
MAGRDVVDPEPAVLVEARGEPVVLAGVRA